MFSRLASIGTSTVCKRSVMREMLIICVLQSTSPWTEVAVELSNVAAATKELSVEF